MLIHWTTSVSEICKKEIEAGTRPFFLLVIWKKSTRNSCPEVFLKKGVLNICSKSTGEHPCRSVISIKLLCNFVEIARRHGCYPANWLHIFRTPFPKNISGLLLLKYQSIRLNSIMPKEYNLERTWVWSYVFQNMPSWKLVLLSCLKSAFTFELAC